MSCCPLTPARFATVTHFFFISVWQWHLCSFALCNWEASGEAVSPLLSSLTSLPLYSPDRNINADLHATLSKPLMNSWTFWGAHRGKPPLQLYMAGRVRSGMESTDFEIDRSGNALRKSVALGTSARVRSVHLELEDMVQRGYKQAHTLCWAKWHPLSFVPAQSNELSPLVQSTVAALLTTSTHKNKHWSGLNMRPCRHKWT